MNATRRHFVLTVLAGAMLCVTAAASGDQAINNAASISGPYIEKIKKRGKIIIGVKYDVPLYAFQNPRTGQLEGFEIDLAREITRNILGDPEKVEFRQVTSDTRIPMLRQGVVDMVIATMTETRERMQQIDFSDLYYLAGQTLLVRASSPLTKPSDLHKGAIAIAKGGTSYEVAEKAFPDTKLLMFDGHAECLEAVIDGRADAFLEDDSILHGMQKRATGLRLLPGQLTFEPYAIGIAKGHPDLLAAVNAAIANIKATGKWSQLYKQNLAADAVPPPAQPEPKWLQ